MRLQRSLCNLHPRNLLHVQCLLPDLVRLYIQGLQLLKSMENRSLNIMMNLDLKLLFISVGTWEPEIEVRCLNTFSSLDAR